jgi:hypothetical protein
MSQGRAVRRIVALYDNIEDLINENDRRCDIEGNDEDVTLESVFHFRLLITTHRFDTSQDRLQTGYIILNNVLPWFHGKASDMEYEDYMHLLKKVRSASINH